MKAIKLLDHRAPGRLEYGDAPDPAPGPGEALVRVRACGLNRLDLWMEQGVLPMPVALPRIPGGEVSGEIAALSANADGWKIGDRVAVQSNVFCGHCEFCARGDESLCLSSQLLGVQCDGGFAELLTVPVRALVRLPDAVAFDVSAALTLAGSTAMHMLTRRTTVHPGDWVLAIGGASGVGSSGHSDRPPIGRARGQHRVQRSQEEVRGRSGRGIRGGFRRRTLARQVRQITGKRGVDLVVEHVGGDVLPRCFECLARGGAVVTCGATAGRDVSLKLWSFFVKEQRLIGSYGRTRQDMQATLEWAAAGKLKAAIAERYPLARTREAYDALRQRQVLGKVVVVP